MARHRRGTLARGYGHQVTHKTIKTKEIKHGLAVVWIRSARNSSTAKYLRAVNGAIS